PAVPEADHLVGIETAALGREAVHALLEVLGRGWVEGDADLAAWDVTGLLASLQQYLGGLGVALQVGGEAALVADVGVVAARAKHLLEVVEGLDTGPQRRAEVGEAVRRQHELLHVYGVVGVCPA